MNGREARTYIEYSLITYLGGAATLRVVDALPIHHQHALVPRLPGLLQLDQVLLGVRANLDHRASLDNLRNLLPRLAVQ